MHRRNCGLFPCINYCCLQPTGYNFVKKDTPAQVFPCELFGKFLRASINLRSGRLLLDILPLSDHRSIIGISKVPHGH